MCAVKKSSDSDKRKKNTLSVLNLKKLSPPIQDYQHKLSRSFTADLKFAQKVNSVLEKQLLHQSSGD